MKAFIFGFIIFFTALITAGPALAQSTDLPTSTTKSFTAPLPAPTNTATNSGELRLLPNPDGSYKIVPLDPTAPTDYQVNQALFGIDIPGTDFISDLASDIWGGIKCASNPGCWIKKTASLVQNALIKQLAGCEYEEADCWEEQYASIMNPNGTVKNAGAVMLLAQVTGDVASMQIPLSTELYLANMNPFKDISAADGLGDLTQPNKNRIFEIWKNARDAAYVLSIVILVIVGFLIMLRAKLDPKTAVNLTNSLPKIIAMLLLITFSLAISGLIIDAGRLIMQLGLSILPNIGFNDIGRLFLNTIFVLFVPILVLLVVAGPIGLVAALAGLIIFLLLLIVIFIICTIILFKLVIRYAKFLLSVMFAPLVILALPLPGGGKIVSDFFKRQFAYMLTIPITVILIEIAYLIASSCIPSPFSGGIAGGPATGLGAAANPCGGVPNASAPNFFESFVPQAEAQSIPGTSFNPFGLFSVIAPFIGLGILSMATKADSIADDIMSIKPLGGHGGGGGGHGGIMALLGLQTLGHGLESASDLSKGYMAIKTPVSNLMKRSGVRRGDLSRVTPANTISGQGGSLLKSFPGSKGDGSEAVRVPTAATFASGGTANIGGRELDKAAFDQKFRDAAPDFEKAGINYPTLQRELESGNYLNLLNTLGGHVGLGALDQSGEILSPTRGRVGRAAGRVFPMTNDQRKEVRRSNARNRIDLIERSVSAGSGLPPGGIETPVFETRGDSGDRRPDTRDTE